MSDIDEKMARLKSSADERFERERRQREEMRKRIGEHSPELLEFLDAMKEAFDARLQYVRLGEDEWGRK